MSQKPIVMEQLKQLLQLKSDGIPIREIARRTGISRNSVRKYLALLSADSAAETSEFSNKQLADKAYKNELLQAGVLRHEQLLFHFQDARAELSKTGVTRQLLWNEYLLLYPDGYAYSQYCFHLNEYLNQKDLSMHMEYKPGDVIMIDFSGKKQLVLISHIIQSN